MNRKVFFTLVTFAGLLLFLYLVYSVVSPFLRSLAWAAILGIATFPLYRSLRERLGGRELLACSLMTPAVVMFLVLPVVALIFFVTGEVIHVYQALDTAGLHGKPVTLEEVRSLLFLDEILDRLQPHLTRFNIDLEKSIDQTAQKAAAFILDYSTAIVKNFVVFVVKVVLMVIALFFIYKNGEIYLERFWSVLPFSERDRTAMAATVRNVLSAVIYGLVLTSLVQGLLAGIGFWIADLEAPILLGLMTAVASLIPVVGAGLIWVPAAIYLFLQGKVGMALFLALWGALLVSSMDNLARTLFISGKGRISILLVALGVMGGLLAFGFVGIIIGPVLLTLFDAIFTIYRDQYAARWDSES